jgi:hypothetical protein
MCMFDYSESVTMIGESRPIARKGHRCGECKRVIDKGERHVRESYKHDGDFHSHRVCLHCVAARGWLEKECGGWCYGGVEEDLREHWHEDARYRKLSLGRLIVGMANGWRKRNGDLMEVPEAKEEAKA